MLTYTRLFIRTMVFTYFTFNHNFQKNGSYKKWVQYKYKSRNMWWCVETFRTSSMALRTMVLQTVFQVFLITRILNNPFPCFSRFRLVWQPCNILMGVLSAIHHVFIYITFKIGFMFQICGSEVKSRKIFVKAVFSTFNL
jgi:hypothetical protein